MLLALSGPAAMANHLDRNDLDINDFGVLFDHDNDLFDHDNDDLFDDDDCGIFRHHRDCDDDDEDLRVIELGDEECLVDEDRIVRCVEDPNNAITWLNNFFAQNDAEQNAA